MLPNYAIMVALACVGGACSSDETANTTTAAECNCPAISPTLQVIINGTSNVGSICSNATFDWLVHTLLSQIAIEKEQVAEKTKVIKTLRKQFHSDAEFNFLYEENKQLAKDNAMLDTQLEQVFHEFNMLRAKEGKELLKPMDCGDLQRFGFHYSGIYHIYPRGLQAGIEVFCDFNNDGGGWTLIQRRTNGKQTFNHDWVEYKQGFGSAAGDFWLGNDNIAAITQQRQYELRVDMTDYEGVSGHAFYKRFSIGSEYANYKLRIKGYSGDAGDAMSTHNGFLFTTHDRDNDLSSSGQCSHLFGNGGWWYGRCYDSNLNGMYGRDQGNKGVVWFQWKGDYTQQQEIEMKIRPLGF